MCIMVHLAMKGPNPKESLKMKGEVVHVGGILCLVSPQNKFWSLGLKNSTVVINLGQGKIGNSKQHLVE